MIIFILSPEDAASKSQINIGRQIIANILILIIC